MAALPVSHEHAQTVVPMQPLIEREGGPLQPESLPKSLHEGTLFRHTPIERSPIPQANSIVAPETQVQPRPPEPSVLPAGFAQHTLAEFTSRVSSASIPAYKETLIRQAIRQMHIENPTLPLSNIQRVVRDAFSLATRGI